ncbi:type I iodothyronine deiodinase-like [Mizuhopecten yessoensis]|uniref:Iodothyronine deiodinase n=1 Tax=Mizuhopecten yessoensis TaxID=6573 RepID=A0A210PVS9_MIZYE|nr:type I iodothyronine deiodinase-like [Mizuhopecten yessoensis]OWF40597.1 Type I iodothyronine deiodinase [Mizuhopecten yessoensis]
MTVSTSVQKWWDKPPLRWILTWLRMFRLLIMMIIISTFIVLFKIPIVGKILLKFSRKLAPQGCGNLNVRATVSALRESFWPLVYDAWSGEAPLGRKVPDTDLYDTSSKSIVKLLSFQKSGRPLVLNFGSCTSPPFMAKLAEFKEIARDFADVADFITIYIVEAHASDGLSIEDFSDIDHHKTLADRVEASDRLRSDDMPCPVLVDPMDDQNSKIFVTVPERLYIVYRSTIVYRGSYGPFNYKPKDVKNWLQKFKNEM